MTDLRALCAMVEPGRIRTTDIAAVTLSPGTLATIRADLTGVNTLAPVLAPVQLDEQVPHGWLWAVDNESRVVARQRWRNPELAGGSAITAEHHAEQETRAARPDTDSKEQPA